MHVVALHIAGCLRIQCASVLEYAHRTSTITAMKIFASSGEGDPPVFIITDYTVDGIWCMKCDQSVRVYDFVNFRIKDSLISTAPINIGIYHFVHFCPHASGSAKSQRDTRKNRISCSVYGRLFL